MTIPLLQELDERQSRMGYVACIALVGSRELDDRDTLRERFISFAFERITPVDARWKESMALIEPRDLLELRKCPSRKGAYRPALGRKEPPFYFLSDLWLKQRNMPSKTAPLDPERADVIIEHARHLGVLGLGYAMTETGSALRATLPRPLLDQRKPGVSHNPMNVYSDHALRAAMAYSFFASDTLLPYILEQIAPRGAVSHFDSDILLGAVDAMLAVMRRIGGIGEAESTRTIAEYRDRVNPKGPAREPAFGSRGRVSVSSISPGDRKRMAEPKKKVHRHHLRPRLEHCIDIGLLSRRHEGKEEDPFQVTPATQRAAQLLAELRDDPRRIRSFLDAKFFGVWSRIQGIEGKEPDQNQVVRCFAEAYELVKRSIGFTPGRTVALAAAFLALRSTPAVVLEVNRTMEIILDAAKGSLNEYFQFSGGTRLDREYMIRVRPEIMKALG